MRPEKGSWSKTVKEKLIKKFGWIEVFYSNYFDTRSPKKISPKFEWKPPKKNIYRFMNKLTSAKMSFCNKSGLIFF